MTILIVLLGLLLSHLVYPVARWRSFDWLAAPLRLVDRRYPERDWAPAALVSGLALLLALILTVPATVLAGQAGWFVMALLMFIYTLGPRDLDRDVQSLLVGGNDSRYLKARRVMRIRADAGPRQAAAAVFHAAQARWFGILFWFVILGVAGALLYRLTRESLHVQDLGPGQSAWLVHLRRILDWPVLVLMLLSAALGGDYDRIRQAWQLHNQGRSVWLLDETVLDQLAEAVVDESISFEDGVSTGHHLVWRMLMIWLVVLSLLLIAGWLS